MELKEVDRPCSDVVTDDTTMIDGTTKVKHHRLKDRLLKDDEFRMKCIIWICLCWSFIILGWVMGQLGPSLLDLQEITGSSLEEASLFVASTFVGYLSGAVISGVIYERMNPYLILFIGLMIMAATSASIPFCIIYEVMLLMHLLKGIGVGLLDAAGNAVLISTFRNEKSARSFMQTLHFTFAIGGIMSPIVTAPFLMSSQRMENNMTTHLENTTGIQNLFKNGEASVTLEQNEFHYIDNPIDTTVIYDTANQAGLGFQPTSKLYQAYLISTGLCITAAIPFIILSFHKRTDSRVDDESKGEERLQRKLPFVLKCLILVLMCCFLGTDNGIEDAYFGFFTTYTVKEYGWTKKKGSYAASVYWAAYAFGRFSAIFIVPYFKPSTLLRIYSKLLVVSVTGLFICTIFTFQSGVWIFSPIIGFAVSVFFPSIFLWTEEDFVPVTGRVASLLMFSAALGSMINPIIIGYLMDRFTPKCFIYITLGQSIALLLMSWIATFLSWYVKRYTRTIEIEIPINGEIPN